jgi:hypothetical protein
MSRFPAGRWHVVGWGTSVAGTGGPVFVEHWAEADGVHDAMEKAMGSEPWTIYAPVDIVSVSRSPAHPPDVKP